MDMRNSTYIIREQIELREVRHFGNSITCPSASCIDFPAGTLEVVHRAPVSTSRTGALSYVVRMKQSMEERLSLWRQTVCEPHSASYPLGRLLYHAKPHFSPPLKGSK